MKRGELPHRHVTANGIRIHYTEQGRGFPVVLCHGFPELWYSWRHQVPALAAAGLRAIAPDLRGYGDTDKPGTVEDYDAPHLVGDLVGLLDALEVEKAVVVGHDWGGLVVWYTALMRPERVERVVALNIPYPARPPMRPTEAMKLLPDGRFNYILAFQDPAIDARLEANLEGFFQNFVLAGARNRDFMSKEDLQTYLEAFRKGGLTGPLNFYRNIDRNWEITEPLHGRQVSHPTLMITAEYDPVLKPEMAQGMERFVPNLRVELIRECGHWTQQEKPQEVNRLLLDFLADLAC